MVMVDVLFACGWNRRWNSESGAVASVFHGCEFFGAGPGDGQEKGGVALGYHVVPDGVTKGEERAGGQVVRLAIDVDAKLAFEDLDGDGAVGVVLLHMGR